MPNSDGVVLKSDSTTFDRDKSMKHFHGSNYSDVRGISENILEGGTETGLETENKTELN